MRIIPDHPPVWTLLAIVAVITGSWLMPEFLYDFQSRWVGTAGMGAGLGLIAWSAFWFRRTKTTIDPHETPTTLLIEGPYRVSRNPIYLGMVVICLGVVIYVGNPLGVLPAILLIWVLHDRFVLPEEQGLIEVFGDKGKAYVAETRRW
jgi:protein-S-isoprenylcysteine O-methyltransferase Ste14